jgi:hypothetical protein
VSTAPPDGTEWSTITLILIGGLFAGIGWIVGVVLLWRSKVWTLPEKLAGTLLWPGGLVTGLLVAVGVLGRGAGGAAIAFVAVAVPLASAWLLWRRTQHWST